MSSGGKGSGRRKTATSAHAPSRPPLKHSSKQGSLTSQHLDPAAGHASKESFIGQSDAMQFENQPGIQIQTSPLIQEQQHAWDQDVDYSYARNQIRAEGDEEAMDEGEAEGEGGGGEITHEDDLDVDDQRGNDDGIFHQPGEAKENYEEEEGEGEGEEEEMTDPDGSDEGEMEAIEGGEEGQEGEGELEGEGGAQEGQGGPVAVVAPELTDTVRMGILAAEARRDNIFEKVREIEIYLILKLYYITKNDRSLTLSLFSLSLYNRSKFYARVSPPDVSLLTRSTFDSYLNV